MRSVLALLRALRDPKYNIARNHLETLANINEHPGITRAHLSQLSTFDTTTISHALSDLKQWGLVHSPAPHQYELTPAGIRFCAQTENEVRLAIYENH